MPRKRAKSTPEQQRQPKRRRVTGRTPNQKRVLRSIKNNHITLCVGPAGTGKTHLSVGAAVEYFQKGLVEKIVVTRPIVQAGERIGYLPGTAEQKLDPYLYPVFDEFSYFFSHSEITALKEDRKIEVVPLALMRGRNFHKSFIIGDEMQNATREQMRMFITRMGMESKLVISGDLTQSDLPYDKRGGFENFVDKLVDVPGIATCHLQKTDIIRNPIIPLVLEKIDG
jgi:phosphate starvation-inducible PhoH-like protein